MARVGEGEAGFGMFAREAGARENNARCVGAAVGGAVLTENGVLVPLHDREAAMIALDAPAPVAGRRRSRGGSDRRSPLAASAISDSFFAAAIVLATDLANCRRRAFVCGQPDHRAAYDAPS
jgi:hypothetical protein